MDSYGNYYFIGTKMTIRENKMINLGDKVRDNVTGLTGIATQRIEFLNGCIQYTVSPKIKKNSSEIVGWNIDEEQLVSLEKKKVKVKKSPTGGPTKRAMRR